MADISHDTMTRTLSATNSPKHKRLLFIGFKIIDILTYGIRQGSVLIIIYILAIQLYASLRFVFMF